jgi:hypothetical protein
MNWLNVFEILLKVGIVALPVIFSAIVGYLFATAKSFREEKQKAYSELLPSIVKMIYDPGSSDEAEFSKSLMKLWLYGSKRTVRQMEEALSFFHNPGKGDVTQALQKAIVEMRKDIQVWPWQRIKSNEVGHLYTKIVK